MKERRKPSLLIVDDDPLVADSLQFMLDKDFSIDIANSPVEAVARARRANPDLALIDLCLPPAPQLPDQGFNLISELAARHPETKILAFSGQGMHEERARALGAIGFIEKPCSPLLIRNRLNALVSEARGLQGKSPAMIELRREIARYADEPHPVLVTGESGSGKERVAESLHLQSGRADAPFITVNCAALSPTLIESALFGHARGAFTGAAELQKGYFEEAGEGTLFLDEIGELSQELQAKLLRVLENGEYQRVGETRSRESRARIIAATHRNLPAEIGRGAFRADLYHRISVLCIHVPPLRELGHDKRLLLDHFRVQLAAGKEIFKLDREALHLWDDYDFPGNVRELRNIVIRMLAKHAGETVGARELECEFAKSEPLADCGSIPEQARHELKRATNFNLDRILRNWERGYIDQALELTRGNVSAAAKLLGVSRTTLYGRMEAKGEDQ